MKNFFQLDKRELEASLVPEAVASINRSISRLRMDLEDTIAESKTKLNNTSTITSVTKFDSKKWVEDRNEALNTLALAEAELKNFNENFKAKDANA